MDGIIRADLPSSNNEPELYDLVKNYQIHRHSKTCRKYKNQKCRFNFGKFFTDHTIVAEPLPSEMPLEEKTAIMNKRKVLLQNVKHYTDTELNPASKNVIDNSKDDYEQIKFIDEILDDLDIIKSEYENALTISDDDDFQIHLRRLPDSCFVNNYFADGLIAWQANLDMQPVFNNYKAVAYMCAYLSKSEDECSHAMKQAVKGAFEKKFDNYNQKNLIAHLYINRRECTIQECFYHILSGQSVAKENISRCYFFK